MIAQGRSGGRALWLLALLAACRASAEPLPSAPAVVVTEPVVAPVASSSQPPPPRPAATPAPAANATGPGYFAGSRYGQDFLVEQLARAQPLSFKPIKSTGGVFRVRLAGPIDAAWKPITAGRPLGPSAEVAAYRLARCLELDNVPPAVWREFPAASIRDALDPEAQHGWPALRERLGASKDDSELLGGAAIYWIPQLADIGLDTRRGIARIDEWLRTGGRIPRDKLALAESLSTMLAFDYLIGNFDRWSGGNVGGNAEINRVYVRDHDLAFPSRMNEKLHRRLWEDVQHAERFSKRFHRALQRLDRACFERELALDPLGARTPLLAKSQLAGVFDRREALLSHIETLIGLHGAAVVLSFD